MVCFSFLLLLSFLAIGCGTFAARAMHLDINLSLPDNLVVSIPNLHSEMNSTRSSTFVLTGASS